MNENKNFHARVMEATGISAVFVAVVVRQVCKPHGIQAEELTREGLRVILADLEKAIALFLTPEDATAARARLQALL